MTRRILALLPGLSDHGGIQRQNRVLCQVISAWGAQHNAELEVVSLRDPPGWIDTRYLSRPVNGAGGGRYTFGVRAALAMLKPYDLLIVGVADFGVLLAFHHLLRRRAPVVTIVHGIEVWSPLPFQQRAALTRADRVISVSAYTARVVTELHGVRPERIVTVPNPLDEEFIAGAEAFHRRHGEPQPSDVLSIARMNRIDAEKGIETLVRAAAQIVPRRPGFTCTIVGEGEDRPRLQALARTLGVQDSVRFAGRLPDDELHGHLAGTSLFALPSRKEGFGIVFLEAMQYGKPVIAGAHGGALEVVEQGVNGELVQYGDVAGLAEAIEGLLDDDSRRAAMGEAGRRMVSERFNTESFRRSVQAVLEDLLDGPRSGLPRVAGARA